MTAVLLDLDDGRALDPAVAGAKAATLAAAKQSGLPVLPGFVLPAGSGQAALAAGEASLQAANSGRARLAVSDFPLPPGLAAELAEAAGALGERLVVRSSARIEGEAAWAGAFASYADILPGEVPVAVTGCWASWFTEATLQRAAAGGVKPVEVGMAVLVQPEIDPEFGGLAHVDADGAVTITGTRGSPAAMLSGWEAGYTTVVKPDDAIPAGAALRHLGREILVAVAALARSVSGRLGKDHIEWARAGGITWLLQARSPARFEVEDVRPQRLPADERLIRLVHLVLEFPGPLGDRLVLPWALGLDPGALPAGGNQAAVPPRVLDRLGQLSGALERERWANARPFSYKQAREALLGPGAGPALDLIDRLGEVDRGGARELLSLLEAMARRLTDRGQLPTPAWIWHVGFDELESLTERDVPLDASRRRPIGLWEVFLLGAVPALTPPVGAEAVVPGAGAGRLVLIRSAADVRRFEPRAVVASVYPLNNLSPLLFDAAGFITIGGSRGAHAFEVAAALGVPSVCGFDLESVLGRPLAELRTRRDIVAAVDGTKGEVSVMALEDWDGPSG